jgi:hypothetical protein
MKVVDVVVVMDRGTSGINKQLGDTPRFGACGGVGF